MTKLEPTRTSSDLTATERFRELLDERGVEWKEHRHVMPGSMAIQRETLWGQPTDVASGKPIPHVYHYRATEMGDGRLFLEAQLVTPEQAIAATLGRGTCQQEEYGWSTEGDHARVWLTCGHDCMVETVADLPNFCPTCGAKVVDE